MTDRQHASLNMFQTVFNLLDANKTKYAAMPDFVRIVNTFGEQLALIREKGFQRSTMIVQTVSSDKYAIENDMVNLASQIASILNAYAADTKNKELLVSTAVTKSSFYNLHDNVELDLGKRIYAEAKTHAEALKGYGVTEEMIESLGDTVAGYESVIAKPRDLINDRKSQTYHLAKLITMTKSTLREKVDKMMAIFKYSDAAFYYQYFNARNEINTAYRKRIDEDPVKAE